MQIWQNKCIEKILPLYSKQLIHNSVHKLQYATFKIRGCHCHCYPECPVNPHHFDILLYKVLALQEHLWLKQPLCIDNWPTQWLPWGLEGLSVHLLLGNVHVGEGHILTGWVTSARYHLLHWICTCLMCSLREPSVGVSLLLDACRKNATSDPGFYQCGYPLDNMLSTYKFGKQDNQLMDT